MPLPREYFVHDRYWAESIDMEVRIEKGLRRVLEWIAEQTPCAGVRAERPFSLDDEAEDLTTEVLYGGDEAITEVLDRFKDGPKYVSGTRARARRPTRRRKTEDIPPPITDRSQLGPTLTLVQVAALMERSPRAITKMVSHIKCGQTQNIK
jgi:hypothetical protein